MKKKFIASILAVGALLSMTGCGVKDWFEKKTNRIEAPPVCDEHVDSDNDGNCDVCGNADGEYWASIWDI